MKSGVIDRNWIYREYKEGEAYIRKMKCRDYDPKTGKIRIG